MTLGEMIRRCREAAGLSQQELAEKLFVSRQTVSRWESGSRTPDVMTAKKIAVLLGVTLDELVPGGQALEGKPEKNSTPPEKLMRCGTFLGILSIWLLIWGIAGSSNFMVIASLLLIFIAAFVFVLGWFPE